MKFIADTMLGTLARWLRIFGFDTIYARDMDDDEIIIIAQEESRTIISRDRELCGRVPGSILLEDTELKKQIRAVLELHEPDKSKTLTRCLECNAPLESVGKERVMDMLPESIRELHDEFWLCATCHKAYWRGSHYRNMLKEVDTYLSHCDS